MKVSGVIVLGAVSFGGNSLWSRSQGVNFPWGDFMVGNCPGALSKGELFMGNCQGGQKSGE